jgi:hypothetical protein
LTKKQFVVVPDGEADPTQFLGQVVLVDEDGEPWSPGAGDSSPVAWGDVTGKPSTFTPATHTHDIDDVTGLESRIADLESQLEALETKVDGLEGGEAE